MLFEIAGIDGSGKSTLIDGVRRSINEQGQAFAYERSFQSEGVRLLESAASEEGRRRPVAMFGRPVVEHVRTVDLVRRSFELLPYAGSQVQHVLTDSYIVEQWGRLHQYGCVTPGLERLLSHAVHPAVVFYLQLDADTALVRMRSRPKGDAILLSESPLEETRAAIEGIEAALKSVPTEVVRLDASLPAAVLAEQVAGRVFQVANHCSLKRNGSA
jgi:thymidylate kinase